MVRYKMSFTILISQAVLYQENISKADQNCVSGFAYISIESIQKEKEQPMGQKDIMEKIQIPKQMGSNDAMVQNQHKKNKAILFSRKSNHVYLWQNNKFNNRKQLYEF